MSPKTTLSKMKSHEESNHVSYRTKLHQPFKPHPSSFNKSRIYNFEIRKKPAELVRKDLVSAIKLPDHESLNRDDYCIITSSWKEEWEKGVQVPVNPEALPHSTIEKIDVDDDPTKHYGQFNLPKELIQYNSTLDEHKSNYELDFEDVCWLQALKISELELNLSPEFLEHTIDKLEQECARNIQTKQMGIEYDDHIVCDVCRNPDVEDGNEMVFCDSCNICVHQACYGILEIPDGDWLCKPCQVLGSHKKKCLLCPNVGGALKPTTKMNKWAHVCCAYWIPEAKFIDLDLLEPVDVKFIPNWRWNLVCSLCNIKKGAAIICDERNCRRSYHVTCAFKHKLKMKIVLPDDDESNIRLKSYCLKHSETCEKNKNESKNNKKEIDFFDLPDKNNNNSAIANNINNRNWKQGRQLINSGICEFWKYVDKQRIFHEIHDEELNEMKKFSSSQLNDIIDLIYQYWKQKRLSNYGNSLIKLTFAEKFKERKNQLRSLRFHLERLRTLTYMICRREKIKLNYVKTQRGILENTLKFVDDEIDNSAALTQHHVKLFSKIITHNSIYSQNVNQDRSSFLKTEDNADVEMLAESTSTSTSTSRATTPVPGTSSGGRRGRKSISENSISNRLIREVKRLETIQASKNNPYAKVYLNSTKSRKSIPSNQDILEDIDEEKLNADLSKQKTTIQKSNHGDENHHHHHHHHPLENATEHRHPSMEPTDDNGRTSAAPSTGSNVNNVKNSQNLKKSDHHHPNQAKDLLSQKENGENLINNFDHTVTNHHSKKPLLNHFDTLKKNSWSKKPIGFQKRKHLNAATYSLPNSSNRHDAPNNHHAVYKKFLKLQVENVMTKNHQKNNYHHHNHHHRWSNGDTFNGVYNNTKYLLRNKV